MGTGGRHPLPHPPAWDRTPTAAPVHSPPCAPFPYVPYVHHHGPGKEPASLGLPLIPIRSEQGGPRTGASPAAMSVQRVARKGAEGKRVMGKARGPAGREGVVRRPNTTDPSPG